MKLYLKHIGDKINIDNIKSYRVNRSVSKFIFSENGIFQCQNNKIIKYKIQDNGVFDVTIGNNHLICDKSKLVKDKMVFKLPAKHYIENTMIEKYQLRNKGLVRMICEIKNDIIQSIYFETQEEPEMVEEDIITFLSLIKS